ncbi:hypothetical protein GAYE_SCF12G3313 [Galdieria yellowstonensis]|uniref:Uncharacterized protein n=1 Tax=Galdieria yellowstonensis TaxID=3028027 RepID=A0AAV9ID52_9RHOD|nr:hypothetical protein GAYE_SCF12G3313 [Galdieria yellowstonensis]
MLAFTCLTDCRWLETSRFSRCAKANTVSLRRSSQCSHSWRSVSMNYSPYSITTDKSEGHIVPGTFSRFEFLEGRVTGPTVLNPSILDFTVSNVSDAAFGEWRALSASSRAKELEHRRNVTKATIESLKKTPTEKSRLTFSGQLEEVYRRNLKIFNEPGDSVGALQFMKN